MNCIDLMNLPGLCVVTCPQEKPGGGAKRKVSAGRAQWNNRQVGGKKAKKKGGKGKGKGGKP